MPTIDTLLAECHALLLRVAQSTEFGLTIPLVADVLSTLQSHGVLVEAE